MLPSILQAAVRVGACPLQISLDVRLSCQVGMVCVFPAPERARGGPIKPNARQFLPRRLRKETAPLS